ncbi:hypothetical protein CFP75_06750, partial [Amycolatopsis alba DSM 44262]
PRTPDTHTPRTPDTHTGPSRGPGQTGPGGRPNQPHQPQPAARGNDFGPGAQPHTGTPGSPGTHGPGTRPGGTGPGNTGPGGRGPGGHSGQPHSPEGHGPDGHGPRQDPDGHPDGSPHDRGPDGEPDRPLTPDEVNQRHSEGTPAGSSYHRGDPDMGDLPHRVQPDPDGRYTVDVHVTPDGHARIGNRTYTPEEFADILRRNGDYDGRPIRLIGCDAGSNDFARRLSRELDTEVMAPSRPAWTDSNGRVFSSDYEIGPDGRPRPKIPPNGEWDVHSPDGTARRASDDGFTPDTSHTDKQGVDADSARSRGDGDDDTSSRRDQPPPGADPDRTSHRQDPPSSADGDIPRDRNQHSVRQEGELLDGNRQQDIHRNPQHQTDFDPPTTPGATPSRVGGPDPDTDIRPPARGERFPGDQQLGRNQAYEVFDDAGRRRGVYHTDGTGRVTHIDTEHPNQQPRVKDKGPNGTVTYKPNDNYHPNPDVTNPHPNTTYRVEVEGHHQTFSTDAQGNPHPSVTFHRPDFEGEPVTVHRGDALAPDPKASFASGGPYAPHTRYEVTDSAGVHRGTFYTDAKGHVRWADIESGRMMRKHPDIEANNKYGIGEGDPIVRQRLDPDAEVPHGARDPERFRGNERVDMRIPRGDSFFDHMPKDAEGKPLPLEPNKKYVVTSEYRNPGREDHTRSIYWTDEHGNVVLETYRPAHPDLNNPAPNMVYNVDDGKFVYHTGPELDGGGTDTVRGRANDLELQEDGAAPNRDSSAQDESNKQATGTPGKYDGGHLFGKQFDSPGELLNMMAQWRPQNQGRKIAGPDHWHAFESDLANFLEKGGGKRKIEGMEVFPMRDGSQVPHTIQVRWIEVDEFGNSNVHMRSFPNNPPARP